MPPERTGVSGQRSTNTDNPHAALLDALPNGDAAAVDELLLRAEKKIIGLASEDDSFKDSLNFVRAAFDTLPK